MSTVTVNVGLLRCVLSTEQTELLKRSLPERVVTRGITGLTGDMIAQECQELNIQFLVLGSPDPVPAMAAKTGIPVLVNRNGAWLRADFTNQGTVNFSPFEEWLEGYVPFVLRAPIASCPEASVLSGRMTPEQVLAVVRSVEDSILLLPEAVPSICAAQAEGVRCIAFRPLGMVEVIVHVHETPSFWIEFEMKPFVP
ncbi:MAG: hypothetical protein CEO22_190 [Candidatus Berkelbacteria bacterium Gr01-1014_85]|uniref:Uncharacterized protein n=1 Tax=Candidatus Berkelbacteria bacterium Gr01-1014_85 TaxID=2017150 RepID=A0A554JCX2_9BACT|nr:MAG: hypothetical protein CEO22_190 [Candidatus Berkelbacteria bacterium Gr01-1014_85]